MKNVLVLTSTFPRWKKDTVPPFVFELSNFLAKSYNVFVLAPHAHKSLASEKMGSIKVKRFRYFPEKLQKLAYGAGILPNIRDDRKLILQIPSFLMSQAKNAFSIVKREKISMVHAHWLIPQGLLGAFIKKKYGIPLIVTIHGSDLFPLKNRIFRHLQKIVVENADIITVPSQTAKDELLLRFPRIKNKVEILPMGIDTSTFNPKKEGRGKYGKCQIILFVGRLNEQKGIEYLIRSMPLVAGKIKNARLLIIGDGEHKKRLNEIISGLKLENIEFLGAKEHSELPYYYRISDAVVLPSATSRIGTEGMGLVLVEAMACGTCAIGSSSGGIKDVIKDRHNGLIFEEKNPEDLANKIIMAIGDKKLRTRLGKNGMAYAKQNYDWKIISKKFLSLYGRLLK